VITIRVYEGDRSDVVEDRDLAVAAIGDPTRLVWVDACDVADDELHWLADSFGLHELEIEDIRERGQRAKLERYPDHSFIVAYARTAGVELTEVDLAVGPSWLVSVRERGSRGAIFDIEAVHNRYDRFRSVDQGVGFLLYTILDTLVDEYFDVIDGFEERLEEIETTLFDQGPPKGGELQHDLLALRRELIYLRRRVVPLRDVVMGILRREVADVQGDALLYFEDVLDHLLRLLDQIDTERELMGNVVDASLALMSNRMNQVMKKMTSWGAILIVATLVAGIYGMNFENMPELHWRYGYLAALATMAASTLVLHTWFKHKDWL
jgi:magnesium transporter